MSMSSHSDTGNNTNIANSHELVEGYQPPTEEELGLLINLLETHPSRMLRVFLRARGLPISGAKSLLRERLMNALLAGRVSAPELVELLDELEGWGNQHMYLYRSTTEAAKPWASASSYLKILQQNKLQHLCNRRNPLVLPDRPTLSTIRCTGDRVRLQWVEKRLREVRIPEFDQQDGELALRAYREIVSRGITVFDWDLTTGHAALMIQRLSSGSNYADIRARFEEELETLVGISGFKRIRLGRAISQIEGSGEARRRQYKHETERGSVASFTSPSRRRDAFEDPAVEEARKALGQKTISLLGNFYWMPVTGRLERELHVKLYPKDQRVGIFGACTEMEVRYLLSRIRNYSN